MEKGRYRDENPPVLLWRESPITFMGKVSKPESKLGEQPTAKTGESRKKKPRTDSQHETKTRLVKRVVLRGIECHKIQAEPKSH